MLLSKKKFEFESLYWTSVPYLSKVKLQVFDTKLDVFLIRYEVGNREIQGLIIEPKDKTKTYPVLIFGRGGNNTQPEESDMGLTFPAMGATSLFSFASEQGYVIYTSQLSGYGPNSGKDEFGGEDVNDILALKDLIDDNPLCDKQKVGMLGYSRGGLMAYQALLRSTWLKTIAVVGAPVNLLEDAKDRPKMQEVFERAFGGSDIEKEKRSIALNVGLIPKDAKILVLQGKLDDRVNYKQSLVFADKLKEFELNHRFRLFEDGSHTLAENRKERDAEILDWFRENL